MKKFILSEKPILFATLLALSTLNAQAETGQSVREALQDPLVWGFLTAVVFMLFALAALNKALNTVRRIALAKTRPESAEAKAVEPEGKSIMQVLTDAKPIEKEADI
jgi:hypothetical protein